ncbi:5E5 antigen-like isoform X2 [Lethenteron reissneri]|uniref:5E5 antigen-like isoform X2 n=1 Tax=Lethenteron reissneri TaxID=7753 RepID=UPI002AB69A72|nr:5E5 antigen-like isoform X2 [Lethenteron reissneri]
MANGRRHRAGRRWRWRQSGGDSRRGAASERRSPRGEARRGAPLRPRGSAAHPPVHRPRIPALPPRVRRHHRHPTHPGRAAVRGRRRPRQGAPHQHDVLRVGARHAAADHAGHEVAHPAGWQPELRGSGLCHPRPPRVAVPGAQRHGGRPRRRAAQRPRGVAASHAGAAGRHHGRVALPSGAGPHGRHGTGPAPHRAAVHRAHHHPHRPLALWGGRAQERRPLGNRVPDRGPDRALLPVPARRRRAGAGVRRGAVPCGEVPRLQDVLCAVGHVHLVAAVLHPHADGLAPSRAGRAGSPRQDRPPPAGHPARAMVPRSLPRAVGRADAGRRVRAGHAVRGGRLGARVRGGLRGVRATRRGAAAAGARREPRPRGRGSRLPAGRVAGHGQRHHLVQPEHRRAGHHQGGQSAGAAGQRSHPRADGGLREVWSRLHHHPRSHHRRHVPGHLRDDRRRGHLHPAVRRHELVQERVHRWPVHLLGSVHSSLAQGEPRGHQHRGGADRPDAHRAVHHEHVRGRIPRLRPRQHRARHRGGAWPAGVEEPRARRPARHPGRGRDARLRPAARRAAAAQVDVAAPRPRLPDLRAEAGRRAGRRGDELRRVAVATAAGHPAGRMDRRRRGITRKRILRFVVVVAK